MQKLTLGIGGFVALLLILGFLLPRHGRFVVTAEVDAHPATVFALVNDLRRASQWSPLGEMDADARIVYSGPARGEGSSVTWDGPAVGGGTQTITISRPYEYVETLINAGEPGESRTWFDLRRTGNRTLLDWSFEHDYGYNVVGRYFALVVTGVIRQDYENSLRRLTELAESLPSADFSDLVVERLHVEPLPIAYLATSSPSNSAAKSAALGEAYVELLDFIERAGLAPAGPPMAIDRGFAGARLLFDAAIPVAGAGTPVGDGEVQLGHTFGGDALRFTHSGGYDRLNQTHRKIRAFLAALGIERIDGPRGSPWESYVSDPARVDEASLLTYIYYPVRHRPDDG